MRIGIAHYENHVDVELEVVKSEDLLIIVKLMLLVGVIAAVSALSAIAYLYSTALSALRRGLSGQTADAQRQKEDAV